MRETIERPTNWNLRRFLPQIPILVLTLVPMFLFIFLLFRMEEIHYFFQGWFDPVYAYLVNGLTFALGSNDIGHTDHPGTPLQLFMGLIIALIGWLRGTEDLANDVLTHPEYYLRIITIALIAINCSMLWMLGYFTYKKLKNKNMAVAIQLLPLLSFQLVNFMPVINTETVIALSSFALAACVILYNSKDEGHFRLLVVIAFLSGLMVASKISTLSILAVSFFFFEKNKSKVLYLSLSLVFMFLFVLPVIHKLDNLIGFIRNIATHTGKYGTGDAALFDVAIFLQSIKKMVLEEWPFTLHLLLLPVGWVVIQKRNISGSLKRLYIGLTVATIFQVLIVARHYSFHYLMPVFALYMPLHGYFWIQLFKDKIGHLSTRMVSLGVSLLVLGVFTRLIVSNQFEKGITTPVDKTTQIVQSQLKGKYIILTEGNNGNAFVEPALRFGYSYAGASMKERFVPILASVYPGNHLWNSREGLTDWNGSYLASDVFSMDDTIYIYANTESCAVSESKISAMIEQEGMSDFVKLESVYQNQKRGEVIVKALVDTAKIIQYNHPELIVETTMEVLTNEGENFKSNTEEYTFRGGPLQSNRYARSGNSSLLLTRSNPYGLNISIPVSKGKRYKIVFWQRSSDQKQALVVATASQSDIFYKTSNQGNNISGEWTRSELNLNLPESFPEAGIQFYLYNPASDSVWVDDFRLTVFE